MCDGCAPPGGWTRRRLLAAGGAAGLALVLPTARVQAQGLEVLPRSAWAGDQRPPGEIPVEPDVRVLVVHHTVNGNAYAEGDVVGLLRGIHGFHTGPDKGWPDVAYNFFVDRFGRIWEGRAGSADGPVAGDATGGSQGFDQKCAFVGDHRTEPPSAEARAAMVALLAMLADRHGIDSAPGATTSFTSRGSNLHPAGTTVTAATITGHRTMSQTACPGDAGMAFVTDTLPGAVTAVRVGAEPATTAPTITAPAAAPTTASEVPAPTAPPTSTTAPAGQEAAPGPSGETLAGSSLDGIADAWPAGVAAAAALVTGALALRARRTGR